jgi:cytochrome c oxidase assembly protein Cox11
MPNNKKNKIVNKNIFLSNFYLLLENKFIYIIFFLVFLSVFEFGYNIFPLYSRGYEERMIKAYQYCGGLSYGYINKINQKYLINNKQIYIISDTRSYGPSYGLFPELKVDSIHKKNLIVVDYSHENNSIKEIFTEHQVNLKEYYLVDKDKNCSFYKKR